jgi:hypothetical protein
MRPLPSIIAAAGLAVAAFAATTPANAAFHLIRWEGNGFCQVWDEGVPTTPWPSDYTIVSESVPTFVEALALKEGLIRAGTCTF